MRYPAFLRDRIAHWAPVLLGTVLFGVSVWAIRQQLQTQNIQDIVQSLATIPNHAVGLAIGLTALNYLMLTGYDTLAVRFVRHPLPYRRTALVATISYAIGNTVGFSLLSGSAIRYRFYSAWGLSVGKVAQIILFCNLSFWLGLFTVAGVMFLAEPPKIPSLLGLPFESVYPVGALFLAIVFAYLIWNAISKRPLQIRQWVLPHLPFRLSLAHVLVMALDWALSAGVLFILLFPASSFSYPTFFSTYLLAQMAAILSNVPGGLGILETAMLLLLAPPINTAQLLGAMLAFRGIYYFIPFAIAVLLFAAYELRQRLKSIRR